MYQSYQDPNLSSGYCNILQFGFVYICKRCSLLIFKQNMQHLTKTSPGISAALYFVDAYQWKTLFGRESRCQRMSYVEGKHVCNAQPLCNQDNRNNDDEKEEKDGIQYTWWWWLVCAGGGSWYRNAIGATSFLCHGRPWRSWWPWRSCMMIMMITMKTAMDFYDKVAIFSSQYEDIILLLMGVPNVWRFPLKCT